MSSRPDGPLRQGRAELTTVGPDSAVIHRGAEAGAGGTRPDVRRYDGLTPDTEYDLGGFHFRTLPAQGALLTTFATVNDVHFGEEECGVIDGSDVGPTFRSEAGDTPYPTMMNEGAVAEIGAIEPAAVLVKGDLTADGTRTEYDAFLAMYGSAFGERLHHVRGNHESYNHAPFGAIPTQSIDLPGVRLAMLDTSVDGQPGGGVRTDQLDWLDSLAADSDRPVLVFGHHHPWDPGSSSRPEGYFGIRPDDSEALIDVVARRPSILGYFAGHTHRNRVRSFGATGEVPWAEVACVKDYPGAWAEYRVYEGGIVQIFHRISTPEALAWSERTRDMYAGTYGPYAFGSLDDRCFAVPPR